MHYEEDFDYFCCSFVHTLDSRRLSAAQRRVMGNHDAGGNERDAAINAAHHSPSMHHQK